MGHSHPLSHLLSVFFELILYLYNFIVKKVHPVFGAGIRTHNLLNASLLP